MQRTLLVPLLALCACASNAPTVRNLRAQPFEAPTHVVLDARALPLREVTAQLASQSGVEIQVAPELAGHITLTHPGVPLDFSLRWVAAQVDAHVLRSADGLRLVAQTSGEVFAGGRRCGER